MLIFPLKKQWYEKIKSGEKTIEYREVKRYWTTRFGRYLQIDMDCYGNCHGYLGVTNPFLGKPQRAVCKLRLGYTNTYMTANITEIEIVDGKDTDLHIDKPVYAIHLTNVKECG